MKLPRRLLAASLLPVCMTVIASGCSNEGLADVQGKVTLDGQPLPGGIIVFEPVDRRGAVAGGEIAAGIYRLAGDAGVPPGAKTVRITGVHKTGRQIEVGPPAPAGTMADEVQQIDLPAIYNQNSTLQVQVTAGDDNQHDFHLNSRP